MNQILFAISIRHKFEIKLEKKIVLSKRAACGGSNKFSKLVAVGETVHAA